MCSAPGMPSARLSGMAWTRTVSCCLMALLLATACARSVPRVTPPPDLSTTERDECEELARATEAQVQGASVWGWAAIGVLGGSLAGLAALFLANQSGDPAEAGVRAGGALAIGASLGGVIGAGQAIARNASARDAAYAEAMNVCLAPAILIRQLGPNNLEVARSLHALAHFYFRRWDFSRAEPLYARTLAIEEKGLGADAPELRVILGDYAELLRRIGRTEEAEELERRARALPRTW
jgi:tetratricopeptide repeat protein